MDISIRKLTPELAEDYVRFFDVTPHGESDGDPKCYCVIWRSDDTYTGMAITGFPLRRKEGNELSNSLKMAICKVISPIVAVRSWDGATPTQTVKAASIF